MEKLIKDIYTQWLAAKEAVAEKYEAAGDRETAEKFRKCAVLKGTETIEELVEILFSPEGQEMVIKHGFPGIDVFRAVKEAYDGDLKQFGIYIDEGQVEIKNVPRSYIIGRTRAKAFYDNTQLYRVCAIRGGECEIKAIAWSVVVTHKDKTGEFSNKACDKSLIL